MLNRSPHTSPLADKSLLERKVIEKILKNDSYRDRINSEIDRAVELIDSGHSGKSLMDQISGGKNEKVSVIELARSRISARGRFKSWDRLWLDSFSSRYATPEAISIHRAERIVERNVVDIGSGAGIQAIYLQSHGGNKVIGIEIDHIRHLLSRINAMEMGVKGIRFLSGDFYNMNIDSIVTTGSVVYSDPLRSESVPPKHLHDLVPNPEIVFQNLSAITENFCFDLPPHLPANAVTIRGEMEYISVDGLLSRLTLYTGKLQESETSAFILPRGRHYSGRPMKFECSDSEPNDYIFLADQAVVASGLLHKVIADGMSSIYCDSRRTILTSSSLVRDFPGEIYRIIRKTEMKDLRRNLSDLGAGRVIPRYSIKPEEYYEFREAAEQGLNGNMTAYLFNLKGGFYLAEKIFPDMVI